jgi:hypothetical protein
LLDALNRLAERQIPETLAALETARSLQDTDEVRRLIDRVRSLADQQAAATQTVQNIQAVLNDGKPEEAVRLASAGLQQFGGTEAAVQLVAEKRDAEVWTAAGGADRATQYTRLCQEGDAALRDRNLRAAAIAFEQALTYGDNPDLRRRYDEVRTTLARYDECRARAIELRRDPAHLEEAIAALQDAARAWDTLQVRQDIDDYTLALQKRRDRLAVADFEVRSDVGIPAASRAVAEELLPAFKCRFDLVEREQLGRVVDELKLDASDLTANDSGRREVGRLARARYLVLGSLSCLGGITANARLVDVRSGLVVQTARLVAASPQELISRLPQLANMLMMSDEQKMAYEQDLARQALPPPVVVTAALPPPPPLPVAAQAPPPPVIVFSPAPPPLGGVTIADFRALPPPGVVPTPVVIVEREVPVRQRLLQLSLQLGDNLFLRGRVREAHAQFELALNLAPGHADIRLRIDRCRPLLPPAPPPVVVAAPPPVVVAAPSPPAVIAAPALGVGPALGAGFLTPPPSRVAVLSFVVNADPGLAPPAFGDWAAEQVASCYAPTYQVVDRGEVSWYMGRLGLTMRDVLVDVSARRWLGRALNVRFFVFGAIEQTASFNVTTHLVDAESGARQGGGTIHVQDHNELKLRVAELVGQTTGDPSKQERLQQEAKDIETSLNEARRLAKAGQPAQAATVCREALKRHPGHAGLQALLNQAEAQARAAELEQQRRREAERQQAQLAGARQRQDELARQAEAARQAAAREAAARGEAERRAREQQRQRAYQQLQAQARQASQQGNPQRSIELLQSAAALKPGDPATTRELAQAKTQLASAQVADDRARRQAEEQRARAAELAQSQARVAEERRRREAEEQARHKAQEARDQAAYAKLLDDGRRQVAQKQYDAALASLQSARRLRATPEVDALIIQVQMEQTRAAAQKKGEQAQVEAERRLAAQDAARKQADAQARHNQELYAQALQQAQAALTAKHYDQAIARFQEAGKLFRTDAVLTGIRQAEEGRARDQAQADAARARNQAQADAARRKQMEDQQRAAEAQRKRQADYQAAMKTGRQALATRRYDDAIKAFTEALRLMPGDKDATAQLQEARKQDRR